MIGTWVEGAGERERERDRYHCILCLCIYLFTSFLRIVCIYIYTFQRSLCFPRFYRISQLCLDAPMKTCAVATNTVRLSFVEKLEMQLVVQKFIFFRYSWTRFWLHKPVNLLSWNPPDARWMIVFRAVNGIGLGMVQPLLFSLVADKTGANGRGRAFGMLLCTGAVVQQKSM